MASKRCLFLNFFLGPEVLEGISGDLNWDLLRIVSCIVNDKSNNDIHENDNNNHNKTNDKNRVIRMMIKITVPVIIIIVGNITLPETNIAPENRVSQKESSLPTIHFQELG